jgi:site-specific recombinase XerC
LRDRALIALMVYSFARVGAALGMKVEDVFTQNRRLWVRLREKGGKAHAMPCHHNLEEYLRPPISTGSACATIPRGRCFAPSRTGAAGSPRLPCPNQTPIA